MYEKLVGKKIKCVWKDGENSKGVRGFVEDTNNLFISIKTEEGTIHISFKDITSIKEVDL